MANDLLSSSVGLPVEFKRMLSWQLSTPSAFPVKKQKKKRQVGSLSHCSDSEEGGESDFDYDVVVVNSDGENEVYYSAPESPMSSGSEQGSLATATEAATSTVEDTPTKQSRSSSKGKSKKQKKKLRYVLHHRLRGCPGICIVRPLELTN